MIQTLQEHAYERIRELLLSGQLAPGSRLSDVDLSKAIGISRTPIREAISRLASEGLVDHRPRSGAFVKTQDRQELKEYYELREWLESSVAGEATLHMDAAAIADLQRITDQMKELARALKASDREFLDEEAQHEIAQLDAEFHLCIIHQVNNRKLHKVVSDLQLMTGVFGHRHQQFDTERAENYWKSHQLLVDVFKSGDSEAARREMAGHIRRGKEICLAMIDAEQARLASGKCPSPDHPESLRQMIHRLEMESQARENESEEGSDAP